MESGAYVQSECHVCGLLVPDPPDRKGYITWNLYFYWSNLRIILVRITEANEDMVVGIGQNIIS